MRLTFMDRAALVLLLLVVLGVWSGVLVPTW